MSTRISLEQPSSSNVVEKSLIENDSIDSIDQERKSVNSYFERLSKKQKNIITYLLIGITSFLMRIIKHDFSDTGNMPVFDEKHYVSQAKEMLTNGGMEYNPNYGLIVHPPLGKWLLSIGEMIFGYTPLGWRIMPILAGVITVITTCIIIQKITNSYYLTLLASILLNIEGVSLIMSRVGMLDAFVEMFVALIAMSATFYAYDEFNKKPLRKSYWLFATGIFGGLMMATKISGVYYMAFCGITLVFATLIISKNVRDTLKSIIMGLFYFVFVPLSIFLMSYIPWFANENSVYRHAGESGSFELSDKLPASLQNFYYYYHGILNFHTKLETAQSQFHPYESKPWEWAIAARPMQFLTQKDVFDSLFDDSGEKVSEIVLFANPIIWYLLLPISIISLIMVILRKDLRWLIVLGGMISGWIPWIIINERQMYLFYVTTIAPFLIIGIILLIENISNYTSSRNHKEEDEKEESDPDENKECSNIENNNEKSTEEDKTRSNKKKIIISCSYLIISLIMFLILSPWVYGFYISSEYSNFLHDMLPRWGGLTDDNLLTSFPNLPENPPED